MWIIPYQQMLPFVDMAKIRKVTKYSRLLTVCSRL